MRVCGWLGVAIAVVGWSEGAIAQIQPDGTLGAEQSVLNGSAIEGGAIRGTNLLHSFQEFNIGNGQRIDFANPSGITDIFSRVTGSNPSHIFGTLGVLGNANLTLLNPNGILFGPNAQLDIRGSFTATTADSALFDSGYEFSAVNPDAPPLLTIGVPLGLQYGTNPGNIKSWARLEVGDDLRLAGENLMLENQLFAGGDLTLESQNRIQIRDRADQPFIAAAQGELTVQGNEEVDIFALNHPESGLVSGGDMILKSRKQVGGDAHYWSGGTFRIEDLNGELGNLYSPFDPIIIATGDVSLANYQGQSLHILAGGQVSIPGYIWIQGAISPGPGLSDSVTLSDGKVIEINSSLEPTIDIRAGIDWSQLGVTPGDFIFGGPVVSPPSFTSPPTTANIEVGTILFRDSTLSNRLQGRVLLTNQYFSNTSLSGDIKVITSLGGQFTAQAIDVSTAQNGGSVDIDSRGEVSIDGFINANAGNGLGGNIHLLADQDINIDSLLPGASGLFSYGVLGGDINLNSQNANIYINEASLLSAGGQINIDAKNDLYIKDSFLTNTNDINLVNPLFLNSTINISARDTRIEESVIELSNSGNLDIGKLNIDVNSLDIFGDSRIVADNSSSGSIGAIEISANSSIILTGTGILSFGGLLSSASDGIAGGIEIRTGSLYVGNLGSINTSANGNGNVNGINIVAQDFISFDNAQIEQQFLLGSGSIGELNLTVENGFLEIVNGTQVGAKAHTNGIVGNINANASDYIRVDGLGGPLGGDRSRFILQNSGQGIIGNLEINTNRLEVTNRGEIITFTFGLEDAIEAGEIGEIRINALDSIVVGGEQRSARIASITGTYSTGLTRGIDIKTKDLNIVNDSVIMLNSFGAGTTESMNIDAESIFIQDGSSIISSVLREGISGDININTNTLNINGIGSNGVSSGIVSALDSVTVNEIGYSGDIDIKTNSVSITDGGYIGSANLGAGQTGDISINATEIIHLNESSIFSRLEQEGTGEVGDIAIDSGNLFLEDGSLVSASTFGIGDASDIRISTQDSVRLNGTGQNGFPSGIVSQISQGGIGNGGEIDIDVNQGIFILEDGAFVSTTTFGEGISGNIEISSRDGVFLNEGLIFSRLNENAIGQGGNIKVQTSQLSFNSASSLSSSTFGVGNAGSIDIDVQGDISLNGGGIFSQVDSNGIGDSGNINASAQNIFLTGGAQINSSTSGLGNAANITLNAQQNIIADGVSSNSQNNSSVSTVIAGGTQGITSITVASANQAPNGAVNISTSAESINSLNIQGNALPSSNTLSPSGLFSAVDANAIGDGSEISLNADRLVLTNDAQLNAATSGTGNAGALNLNVRQLDIQSGGAITAFSSDSGDAGQLNISASESIHLHGYSTDGSLPSGLFFDSFADSNAGQLNISTQRLTIDNGARISARNFGSGQGGNLNIQATDSLEVRGISNDSSFSSGLFFDSQGSGNARGIKVNTGRLDLRDGGTITVSGSGTGISGALEITANSIDLINQGSLRATTTAAVGGNMRLNVRENIWLRHNSEITAEAFDSSNGGNIEFNVGGAILARLDENSDIVANSERGRGGTITGSALFVGNFRQFVDRRTPESDFIASSASGIDGVVDVTVENLEPDVELPAQLTEPEVADTCQAQRLANTNETTHRSEFYVTGEGGVAPSPEEMLSHSNVEIPFLELGELDRGEEEQIVKQPKVMPDESTELTTESEASEPVVGLPTPCQTVR